MKNKCAVVALGMFDGVHMGHRALISAALKAADEREIESVIYTFSNHPQSLISRSPKLLLTANERLAKLDSLGACAVTADAFDASMANMPPRVFAQMLVERFDMKVAAAGYNYSFGKGGSGGVELLQSLGDELGFDTIVTPPVTYLGKAVSSSRIRRSIEEGDIESANIMLCESFMLSGIVISNRHIGTGMGFPTANIAVDPSKVLPKHGVYAVNAYMDGKRFDAVTNIGSNPTLGGKIVTVETHMIGFNADIYGEKLTIEFICRMRDDIKFDSVDELKRQIEDDICVRMAKKRG